MNYERVQNQRSEASGCVRPRLFKEPGVLDDTSAEHRLFHNIRTEAKQ